ncbi:hypothetical protein FE391_07460 [Nonomuraea sp. KC401]|uniref:hypothetical protein n=1 Tax=unclassified Nonomuraea TaxID=2593643 RepID=UPI0010FDC612|nr:MULTISPECIES: hypothetical protein [unclassified Nonomuraea]NBE93101.1 hypothetical protein [Nonomuraea sp. K271]TLF80341.1 hypothetical protein FE391_07460 [Nonomuraea sp. KC401]
MVGDHGDRTVFTCDLTTGERVARAIDLDSAAPEDPDPDAEGTMSLIALCRLLEVSESEDSTTPSGWTPQPLSKTGHRATNRDVGWPVPHTN